MHSQTIYIVCAEGEERLAEELLARPLHKAGYEVTHAGTVMVGESLVGEAQKALASGSPIVLCATTRAAGSQWAHHIVNAGHASGPIRVFVVQMEKQAYVDHLALKARVAKYCDNPAEALRELLDALAKHFPPTRADTTPSRDDPTVAGRQFSDQLTESVTFDIDALQRFRSQLREEVCVRYPATLSAWEFLDRVGLWAEGRLTRTGALLFARNPAVIFPTATVKCTRYYGTDRGDKREPANYEDTVPAQIVAARQFVADRVRRGEAPSTGEAQSTAVYDYPMVAVREIIANALVHRDYESTEECVHVRLFTDRLEVSSPGTWRGRDLSIGTEYDLARLEGQSVKRNFRLAQILSWIKLVEGEGSGIPSALRDCQATQSPTPTVVQEQRFVTVTLRRRMPSPAQLPMETVVHRTIVAVDVEGFGNQHRINPQQVAVREGLYRVLRQAFHAATIPWAECHHEDRGDGVLILARPEVAKSVFVEALPDQLVKELREHNSTRPAPEQIQLRMALHAGELHYDDHGVAGASVNLTFRLLDAEPLKSALAGSPGVLALVTSDWFFEEVVRHSPAADPTAYRRVRVRVKETDTVGWVHLPDHPYPSRRIVVKDPLLEGLITAVPHQLPADTAHFVGRVEELHQLSELLDSATEDGGTVVISAVSGTAGVGKSALALRWAHQVRGEFPDGQLYVNLRGYDPDQPLSSGDALAGFLRALGLAGAEIPLEVEERAAAYRSLLDGRRILVVLDNASSVEQVRPLLPGTPSAVVVVTSRDSLAGLVARHGAVRLDLDLLPPDDAVALLGALIGARVAAEPDAAAALAGQCARLPLAMRLAAELAAARPATPLAALVTELADEQRRLELLDAGGDPRTAIRAVFSWSYQHLPAEAARAFRLLGLHPGPDLDPYAAAALIHTGLEQAQHLLDQLARVQLIGPTSPRRYGMHDLLRAYATYLAAIEDSEAERWVALTRLFDHYLGTAAAAMDVLVPAERHHRPRVPAPATASPPVADPATARAWLDTERVTLTTVCAYTAAHGWPGHTTWLAGILFRYLEVGGHYPNAVAIHTHALHAARDTGDRTGEAHVLTNLGAVYWRQGHYQGATDRLQQALTLFREIGDRVGEARALDNLGLVYQRQGYYPQAVEHHQQALTLFVASDDQIGEARTLDNLGLVYQRLGRYEQAADYHQMALGLFREIGYRGGEAKALNGIGETHRATGDHDRAHAHHGAALALAVRIGDRYEQARAHDGLAHTHHATAELDQARHHWRHALALYNDLGVPGADDVHAHLTALDRSTGDNKEI